MTAAVRRCGSCRGHSGGHFHWCTSLAVPTRPAPAAPVTAGTGHLPHHLAPESGWQVNLPAGLVVEVTSAVLCPECSGDWCEACDFTGMAQPAAPAAPLAAVHQLPGGACVGKTPRRPGSTAKEAA